MKVIHATEVDKGGTVTVMKHLALQQIASKKITNVLCLIPDNSNMEFLEIPKKNIRAYPSTGRNLVSFIYFFIFFIRTIWIEKPDIVHLHSTFAGILGRLSLLLLSPFRKPKVIYCPHGFSFLMEGSQYKKKLFSKVELFLSRFTNKIICVSNYEKKSAVSSSLPNEKIAVIHNCVPIPNKYYRSIATPYDKRKINFLFAGRLDPAKGFDILLTAMRSIKNSSIHLTVAGINENEVKPEDRLQNITYKGWLSANDLTPYIMHADVLVLPSRWEGFPMVVLEAMSWGVPVVASDCTSLSEAVQHTETGLLFETSNTEQLATILSTTPITRWKEMGKRGEEAFLKNFTSSVMTDSTLDLYYSVLRT